MYFKHFEVEKRYNHRSNVEGMLLSVQNVASSTEVVNIGMEITIQKRPSFEHI